MKKKQNYCLKKYSVKYKMLTNIVMMGGGKKVKSMLNGEDNCKPYCSGCCVDSIISIEGFSCSTSLQ